MYLSARLHHSTDKTYFDLQVGKLLGTVTFHEPYNNTIHICNFIIDSLRHFRIHHVPKMPHTNVMAGIVNPLFQALICAIVSEHKIKEIWPQGIIALKMSCSDVILIM